MKFALSRFLISFDIFGHRPELTYKGLESYGTAAGGIASLAVKVATLISFIYYVDKMIKMKDPNVTSYELDLTEEEKMKNGAVNLADKDFFLGISPMINEVYVEKVPPEVGKFFAEVESNERFEDGKWTYDYDYIELEDCHEVIPEERQDWVDSSFPKCVDPKNWNVSVNIDNTANGEWQIVNIGFELCDIKKESNNCLDDDALEKWFAENRLGFELMYP